jgi:hypothetical protein
MRVGYGYKWGNRMKKEETCLLELQRIAVLTRSDGIHSITVTEDSNSKR